ncbi:MAG: SocA family protein [Bryobacterales bacterium]|nr:SocA family protein [Bryobacterales bacterium]
MDLQFQYDFEATKAALLRLAAKGLPFDKYRACKLLFLADREHLLRFGRPITGDNYNALPLGPTPSQTLTLLDQLDAVLVEGGELPQDPRVRELADAFEASTNTEYPQYVAKVEPDPEALSETDVMVLDDIAKRHGNAGFLDLKRLTHELKAYSSAWRQNEVRRKFPMRFEDFFADDPDKLDFLKELQQHQFLKRTLAAPRD